MKKATREWIRKAEADYRAARKLEHGNEPLHDQSCFFFQQCVEKYLKAFLVLKDIDCPKTHHIDRLIALFPQGPRVPLTPEERHRLTAYATFLRYPGDDAPISLTEAHTAVAAARRVRKVIRRLLPRAAVRRRQR